MIDAPKIYLPASLLMISLGLLSAIAVGPTFINHDVAWYLYVVRRWLDGAALYRDVVDTNPPLIIWLSTPPVWAAGITGWPATALFKIWAFVLAAMSLLMICALVRRAWRSEEFVVTTSAAFLVLPFVKADFGQREHFAVLLTMPYVFAAVVPADAMSARLRTAIGAAAGLGFLIKPHFLAAWLAIEAVAFSFSGRDSLRRRELVVALLVMVGYAVSVLIFTPGYWIVAEQVRQVYGGLNSPFPVLLRLREVQLWLAATALFAAIRWPHGDRLPTALFATATGFLVAALLQFKGWGYQLYPARVFLILFLLTTIAVLIREVPSLTGLLRGGRTGLSFVLTLALLVASGRYVAEARSPVNQDLVTPTLDAIRSYAREGPIAVLSMRTIIYPAFPAVNYAGARWSLRHNSLWFLPGLYSDQEDTSGGPIVPHTVETMSPLERAFLTDIVDDLCASPPKLLAIERALPAAPAGRRSLDLQAYYSQSPRVKALLERYRVRGSIGPFTILVPESEPVCR